MVFTLALMPIYSLARTPKHILALMPPIDGSMNGHIDSDMNIRIVTSTTKLNATLFYCFPES
jgi:hypothetical protein